VPDDARLIDASTIDASAVDAVPIDATEQPGTVVHVSPTGNDSDDGLNQPVKTIKRAIEIAEATPAITSVALAAGRYAASGGESFPYTVPPNLTLRGPATGGAILAGTKTEVGLTIYTGLLQDLQLEDFTVAITAIGIARLTNVIVKNSQIAIRGETTAKLTVDNLDITGFIGANAADCQSGVVLVGAADLTVTRLIARNFLKSVVANDATTLDISNADILTDSRCFGNAFEIATSKTFRLAESSISGDGGTGIGFLGAAAAPTQATVTNTTVRGLSTGVTGSSVVFQMTGGEISGCQGSALSASNGTWSLANVKVQQNGGSAAILLQGRSPQLKAVLSMRGCSVLSNAADGVYLFSDTSADLGTAASPGVNVFRNNTGIGVVVFDDHFTNVEAVGNTWNASTQGSDANGRYPSPATIPGPVSPVAGGNFGINSGSTLRR
jgi:hypothetical protein